jgi:hypothetical protein
MIIEAINKKLWEESGRKIKEADSFYGNNFAQLNPDSKLYVYESGGNVCLLPFFISKNKLFSFRYGGLLYKKYDRAFFKEAILRLNRFCIQHKIRGIVIRSHPFLKTIRAGRVIKKEPFVYIDLSLSGLRLKRALSIKHQECIESAASSGLIFSESRHPMYLKFFYDLYAPMLKNKNIAPESFAYFERLFNNLKGNVSFASIRYNNKIMAVSILFRSSQDAYMMYGGMNEAGYRKYAKHFMIYNLIFRYKKLGYKRLVLGTGEKSGDSIYMFKRGFADKTHYLNTYEKIFR